MRRQAARRVGVVLDFGWRSAGVPSAPGLGVIGERFTAAIKACSVSSASAAAVHAENTSFRCLRKQTLKKQEERSAGQGNLKTAVRAFQ